MMRMFQILMEAQGQLPMLEWSPDPMLLYSGVPPRLDCCYDQISKLTPPGAPADREVIFVSSLRAVAD